MLQNSFYTISGTFYTLLNNTDLYLSYFILNYVFLGHNDSVEWGLTDLEYLEYKKTETILFLKVKIIYMFWMSETLSILDWNNSYDWTFEEN